MNPANVLRIHEIFMAKYDQFLPYYLYTGENNNLDNSIETLKQLLTAVQGLSSIVAGEAEVVAFAPEDGVVAFDKPHLVAKIDAASLAAFHIATDKMKDESDCEAYKKGFRAAFDAALRVELYRQFIAKGQNFAAQLLQHIKKKSLPEQDLKSLMDSLFVPLSENTNSILSKFQKAQGTMSEADRQKVNTIKSELNGLLAKFIEEVSRLSTTQQNPIDQEAIQKASLDYQIAAGQLIRRFQLKNESDESWSPLFKNLLLIITGLGAVFMAISLINKATTGHYMFFDRPVIRDTPQEEMAPEDILLDTAYPTPA